MRRALLTLTRPAGATAPVVGSPYLGGFYVGIIDTTRGNIIAADQSQTGLRYELIVSPQSLAAGNGLTYQPAGVAAPTGVRTRWDGLTATAALAALAAGSAPAAQYVAGLAYPSDGASPWYLPALDELELIYRTFKPTTSSNNTTGRVANTFPGGASEAPGRNPSSDPQWPVYTAGNPAQTTIPAFITGGAEAINLPSTTNWSSTEGSATAAWNQVMSNGQQGGASGGNKTLASVGVRPVRRRVLT